MEPRQRLTGNDALRELSFSGSKRQTLILAVEDLHWIDKISEEFLAGLVESLSGLRIWLSPQIISDVRWRSLIDWVRWLNQKGCGCN